MNSSDHTSHTEWTSFALGLLTAGISVVLSHMLWLFFLATDRGGFIVARFFSPTLYSVVVTLVVSLVVCLVIVLSLMTFVLPELGGIYFGFAIFSVGIISMVLALPLGVALTMVSMRRYHSWMELNIAQPQIV